LRRFVARPSSERAHWLNITQRFSLGYNVGRRWRQRQKLILRKVSLLNKRYGKGRWRKKKGVATVKLTDGSFRLAEIHWYEAHGIGKKDIKIKFPFLD